MFSLLSARGRGPHQLARRCEIRVGRPSAKLRDSLDGHPAVPQTRRAVSPMDRGSAKILASSGSTATISLAGRGRDQRDLHGRCRDIRWSRHFAGAGLHSRWSAAARRQRSARTAMAPSALEAMTLWPPMKRAMKAVAGASKISRGGPMLHDAAVIHHHHQIGQRQRFLLAMGNVDEADAEFTLQTFQFFPHMFRAGRGPARRAARPATAPWGG